MEIFSQLTQSIVGLGLPAISQAAATVMFSTLWQSIAIAGALSIALKRVPGTSAKMRFALWTLAFLASIWVPFLPMFGHGSAVSTLGGNSHATKAWISFDIRWSFLATEIWICASIYKAVELLRNALRLRQLWRSARPVSTGLISFKRPLKIELCTADRLERPTVIGFLRPKILIPEWLFDQLTPEELDQILLHESEHLSRRDDWTNLLQKLALVLFPLNPGLWWIERQLCMEREMACDEAVVNQTSSPCAYATCLADLAERSLRRRTQLVGTLSLGAWEDRSELARRIHRILLHNRRLAPIATWTLAFVLGTGVVVGSLGLSRCPAIVAFEQPIGIHSTLIGAVESPDLKSSALMVATTDSRIVNLKIDMPKTHPTSRHAKGFGSANGTPRSGQSGIFQPLQAESDRVPVEIRLHALGNEMATQQRKHVPVQQHEQWIVLTAWDGTVAPLIERPIAAMDAEDFGGKTQGSAYRKTSSDIAASAQFTQSVRSINLVQTRMIFEVVGDNSDSWRIPGQSARRKLYPNVTATVPVRSGWLIFQL